MRSGVIMLAGALSVMMSCASVKADYTPPPDDAVQLADYRRVIELPFESVWEGLIQHAAGTFFGIDNFERESGLLTLAFGADAPSEFVDGGHWKMKAVDPQGKVTNFDGPYVEFLRIYQSGTLTGRMNIVVRKIDDLKTEVTINTRYVFVARSVNPRNAVVSTNTWSFNSGSSATVAVINPSKGTPPTRTMKPTHKAERAILDALNEMK